ncbi:MAG: hypothetical protein U0787_08155 [Polyangia bacterium]
MNSSLRAVRHKRGGPRLLTAAALLLFLGFAPRLLHAEQPQQIGEGSSLQELTREAKRLFDAGDFDGSARLSARAYEKKQHPVILFNMAQARRKAGQLSESLPLYERFLRDDPKSPLAPEADAHCHAIRAQLMAEKESQDREHAERIARDEVEKAEAIARAREEERKKAELDLQRLLLERQKEPIHKTVWFKVLMASLGVAVVGGVAAGVGVYVSQRPPDPPASDLGTYSIRF